MPPLHLGKVGGSLLGGITPKVPGRWLQQGQGSETLQKDWKIDVCCLNKPINVSNSIKIQGVQRVNNTQRNFPGPQEATMTSHVSEIPPPNQQVSEIKPPNQQVSEITPLVHYRVHRLQWQSPLRILSWASQ